MTDLCKAANEFNPDWNQIEALQEALREHMVEIQRLRQALAQPEQEPVNVVKVEHDKQVELAQAYERGWNAALAHGQEPVAWMSDHDVDFKKSSFGTYPCVPLYTAPPKREWHGMTDDEIKEVYVKRGVELTFNAFARAIEATLKEKNGG